MKKTDVPDILKHLNLYKRKQHHLMGGYYSRNQTEEHLGEKY